MQPELKKFLDMPFLGCSLRDAITADYAFFPLPYHHVSWIPHKVIPYIINKCLKDTIGFKMSYYIDFSFKNQEFILVAKYNDCRSSSVKLPATCNKGKKLLKKFISYSEQTPRKGKLNSWEFT